MSIVIEHLNYIYSENTAYQRQALKDINLEIREGQFIGLIGHTGSGKSTLIQHLNVLLKESGGVIRFNGENIYDKDYDMRKLRAKVGLVFSTRSTSCLRWMSSVTCVLARKTRGFRRKRQRRGRQKPCV